MPPTPRRRQARYDQTYKDSRRVPQGFEHRWHSEPLQFGGAKIGSKLPVLLTACLPERHFVAISVAQFDRSLAHKHLILWRNILGGCSRTRTCDPLIKSQLLYHLSYTPCPYRSETEGSRVLAKGPFAVHQPG